MNQHVAELAIDYGKTLMQKIVGVAYSPLHSYDIWQTWTNYLWSEKNIKPLAIQSIWSMVTIGKHSPDPRYIPVCELSMEEHYGVWKLNPHEDGNDIIVAARSLGTDFVNHGGTTETNFDRFYYLMQKYASTLPCTYGEDGVSLFQQWRLAAAVMATAAGETPDTLGQELILIGLDLPGIQETVYTIASRGAGKSVRGRSAFVQLLVNAIVDRIVRDLDLCRANVLINAGGNALILAGATAQVESYLQTLDYEINNLLLVGIANSGFTGFQGDLALALAWTKLPWGALTYPCEKVFDDGRYISRWQFHEKQLKEKLQAIKMRPFGALVATEAGFQRLFATEPIDSNRYCAVCRRPESKESGLFASWHEEEPEILGTAALACPVCKSFVNLADSLGKHGIYLERTRQAQPETEVWQRGLYAISGYWYTLTDQPLSKANTLTLALSPDDFPTPGVSGFWPMATTTPLVTAADRTTIALAGEKAVRAGSIRDNALLADESPGTFKRLGVLKADVDSLGELLINGLRDERSAARTATLSESLTLFFGGWLDQICAAEQFANKVYVLYAGGDDLLVIGAWDVIPLLAARIAHDFHLYTGKNPGVHLSAGITVVGAKEPLYAAVEAANKALKQAKQYPTPYNATKNAINFLEKVVDWSDFQEVQQWRAQLLTLMADGAPKSLLMTLLQIYGQYEDDHKSRESSTSGYATRGQMGVYEKRSLYLGPWLWQMIYRLHRLPKGVLTREKIQEIQTALLQTQREHRASGVEKIALSARWTQLLARKE